MPDPRDVVLWLVAFYLALPILLILTSPLMLLFGPAKRTELELKPHCPHGFDDSDMCPDCCR